MKPRRRSSPSWTTSCIGARGRGSKHDETVEALLAEPTEQLSRWVDKSSQLVFRMDERHRSQR